jgi:hypothetical protein
VAGYRDFQTGEVLTAANVNDFLMEQAVMTFADAAARDTALTSVLREGMVAYLQDTDEVVKYDGSAWTSVGEPSGLVAVKHALFTGTQSASVASGGNVAVTDLSITHTLADASNKLIISAYFGAAANSIGHGQVGIAVADNGTLIGIGDEDGNRTRVAAGGRVQGTGVANSDLVVTMPSVTFVYEPDDTNEHTYTVRAINIDASTRTLHINRDQRDIDTKDDPRASSGFVVQEVRV